MQAKSARSSNNPSPRKRRKPAQQRALHTIDCILDGCQKTLLKHGYRHTTTNHIAEAAGISIGSLYQYFDNKDEVISALMNKHADRYQQKLKESIALHLQAPFEQLISETIATILAIFESDREIYRLFRDDLPNIPLFDHFNLFRKELINLVGLTLKAKQSYLKPKSAELAAFVAVNAVDGVIGATTRMSLLDFNKKDLVQEITNMVVHYLTESHG